MKFKIFLFLIFILLALPFIFAFASPLEFPLTDVNSLEINIKIDQKGEVEVVKKFLFSMPTSDFIWQEDLPISNPQITSSGSLLNKKEYQLKKEKGRLIIKATKEPASQIWLLHYKAPSALKPDPSFAYDSFSLPLVSEPGVYIKELSATLHLPAPVPTKQIKQKVYAVHGVGEADFYLSNSQTLAFTGSDLSPFSIYTIQASWPKGTVLYPFFKRFSFFIQSLGFEFWVSIGIILPLLSLLVFLYMLLLKKRAEKLMPLSYLDKPPENLPPAIVGVLFRQSASQREIIATILDLAQRGFIDIVKKREEYILGKREGKGALRSFEAWLYDKLFTQQGERKIKRTEFELEKRASEQLYSPKISQFYQDLYLEVQRRNYFIKNPALVVLRYRVFGILFFLSALFTSFLAIRYSFGPPFALFGSFGQILASLLIIKIAPLMSKRTKEGKKVLSAWLSFGRFLSDKKPLGLLAVQQGIFEKYLPYAVALEKELDWAYRCSGVPYTPPSWYVAEETVILENFVSSLFYITGSLSQLLYSLREPGL